MADNLIFPIGFDLEKGVKDAQAQMDNVLRRLQKTVDGKPLTIPMSLDPSKFTTFESALRGSIQHITDDAKSLKAALDSSLQTDNSANINRITEAMRSLEAAWKALPNNQKFDINDRLTPKAQEMVRQFNELATASSTYGQTLSQIAGKIKRVADEEARANQKRNDGYAKLRKTLGAQENSIANLSAKIKAYQQVLNSKEIGSRSFERVAEKIRKLSEKLEAARAKIKALTQTAVSSNAKHAQSVNRVTQEYQKQDGYVSRLLKRLAVYASFSYASQFLTSIREVTAQFELQRVSLGAIIQDTSRANQLWSEIKTFALKSPVKILDLTKYTKQVAAYGIETDKLFDTTKRIMDISVGLGVDASRLVLAFGQVKAASYLRAAEIRQFTEAGIPMLELLAEKFTELNGKAVTTEQVMDMVSKRMVGFDMVEQIFKDMTSAGGMFFDMQEKQGNTLYGLWAKLGDAASIMYDEIGNTDSVNSAMKDSIQFLTDLMKNWRLVGREMVVAAGTFLLLRANTVLSAQGTALAAKATNDYATATTRLNAAQKRGAQTAAYAASLSKKAAVLNRAASISTNAWTAATLRIQAAMYSLKAAFIGNWATLAIAAVAAISAALYSAYEKAHKLQNELKEIRDAGQAESAKSVFNFERLANAALEAATGSREQKEALDELKRSYGDIIPVEQLSLENLQKLRAQGYEPLTATIKEYIAQRTLQKEIDAITSHYTEDTIAKQRQLRELFKRGSMYSFFKGVAWSPTENLDDDQISQVFANVDKIAKDKSKSWEDVWIEAIKGVTNVSEDAEKKMREMFVGKTQNAQQQSYNNKMRDIVENTRNMADETDTATKKMEVQTGLLGKYKQTLDETSKSLVNLRLVWSNGKEVDPSSFLGKQMVSNASIKAWKDDIIENLQDAGIAIKNEWFNIITNLNPKDPSQISSINFDPILDAVDATKDKLGDGYVQLRNSIVKYQELYDGIVPSDRTVSAMRSRLMQIATNIDKTGGIMNDLQRHLMESGDNWENYSKSVRDAVKDYEAQIDEMKKINASIKKGEGGVGPVDPSKYSDEEIKKVQLLVEALKQLFPLLAPEKSSGGGRTSDPRLQNLKEEISLTKKLYDEYHKLEKQIGATKAAEKIQDIYSNTIKTLQDRAGKYGFKFELPFTDENLKSNMQHFIDKMKELQGLKDKKGKPLFPNIGKEIDEVVAQLEDVDLNSLQKALEKKLKELSDRISRTKTAKEFYEKILSQTGDIELATRVSLSIYGSTGEELFEDTVRQIREVFKSGNKDVEIDLSPVFDMTNQRINYKALADIYDKYQDQIIEKNRSTAENIVKEGQKTAASNIATWEKELAKAKDYEEQRTDIINRETQRRAEIYKSNLPQEEKDRLAAQSQRKQDEDLAKVNFEEFTKSEDYIKIFENLDNVATSSLKRLRAEMQTLIDTNQNLSPENMETLVKAMEDIDEQISGRGFGNDMIQSVNDYIASIKNLKIAKQELAEAEAEYQAQLPQLDEDIATAEDEKVEAQRVLNDLKNNELATENQIVAAELRLNTATANVAKAEQAKAKAADKVKKAEQKVTGEQDKQKKATTKFVKDLQKVASTADQLAGELSEIKELLGISEDSAAGLVFDSAISSLQTMSTAIDAAATAQAIFNAIAESNPYIAIAAGVLAVGSAIASWISGSKVRKANKEIERQKNLLDQLEYTYGRLEKAADKVFGAEYLRNYNKQIEILQAEAEAKRKQAEAERSKGKKEDKDATKQYLEEQREIMDQIAEMEGKVSERMLGTDLTSAARDFAKAWLDAYKEFGNTADAMSKKFHEMIENMVVESLLAKAMQRALEPTFKMIDQMKEEDFYDQKFWARVMRSADEGAKNADAAGQAIMKWAEQWGYNGREQEENFTGIAKNISGATSEEINTAAQIGNTLMYYVSPIPRMDEKLARIVAIMESRTTPLPTATGSATAAVDYTELFNTANKHLSNLPRMEQHLSNIYNILNQALRTKGSITGFDTFLNS